jgi:hypothetical protein
MGKQIRGEASGATSEFEDRARCREIKMRKQRRRDAVLVKGLAVLGPAECGRRGDVRRRVRGFASLETLRQHVGRRPASPAENGCRR